MADINDSKLFEISTGILNKNACVVIVRTEWNSAIVNELEKGCIKVLQQYNMKNNITKNKKSNSSNNLQTESKVIF